MPSIARTGDDAGGPINNGASSVFANGKKIARIGDPIKTHGDFPHNVADIKTGSSTVFVEGVLVSMDGELADCDHTITSDSSVFAS